MKSVFQTRKVCFFCNAIKGLHSHHIFEGTANRRKSEQYGFKVWLCAPHHNMSNEGVHFNKEKDIRLKQMAQTHFELQQSREVFIQEFGKSWL